ncbi:SDR family NAD(P)-dependent oxidoreductase [Beijerinckia sp. L45]|uniref:SDR family NAD(P)-dependent oxidoreductase n=1 Tax=Beijerinckia sp. L45 TaxID=1641855 RepID=UPI00131C0605|nr:SDR family NAD(P)-dependent oxidoreductase [Beijerinckia sp. L45]
MTSQEHAQVLITGGSVGIGLGLAQRYLAAGARVLVTGREEARLRAAAASHPGLLTHVSDMGSPSAREALARDAQNLLPNLSVVINNAGIQRRVSLAMDTASWAERQTEIDILLAGPVHLNSLLVPVMVNSGRTGMVVNVTSGGANIPQPFAPVYSACKAALHSYTVTLRHALCDTRIAVKELIPPAVATKLAGTGATHGVPLDEFCDAVFTALVESDELEIGFGMTATDAFAAHRDIQREMFKGFAARFPVKTYAGAAKRV